MMFLLNEGIFIREPSNFRLEGFVRRSSRLGIDMDIGEDGRGIMKNLMAVSDHEIRAVYHDITILTIGSRDITRKVNATRKIFCRWKII